MGVPSNGCFGGQSIPGKTTIGSSCKILPPSILSMLAHFLVLLGAGTELKFLQIIWLDIDPYAVWEIVSAQMN